MRKTFRHGKRERPDYRGLNASMDALQVAYWCDGGCCRAAINGVTYERASGGRWTATETASGRHLGRYRTIPFGGVM